MPSMRLDCFAEKAQVKTDSKGTFAIQWMLVRVSFLPLILYRSTLFRNQTSDEGNRRFSRLSLLGSHVAVDPIPMVIIYATAGSAVIPMEVPAGRSSTPSMLTSTSTHHPLLTTSPSAGLPSTCLKEIPAKTVTMCYVSANFLKTREIIQ
ncbi:hypothetical protein QQF64_004922 [Cirrhinus molitorella]|uniref:Uncharacterized protein n=1 Tax=Cirrhinus molitorella TaxID=172907 RepID=A0ABR3MK96_9TELE